MLDFSAFSMQHGNAWPRCDWSSEFKTKEQATNLDQGADSPRSFWPQHFGMLGKLGLWGCQKKKGTQTFKTPTITRFRFFGPGTVYYQEISGVSMRDDNLQFCGQTLLTLPLKNNSHFIFIAKQSCQDAFESIDLWPHLSLGLGGPNFESPKLRSEQGTVTCRICPGHFEVKLQFFGQRVEKTTQKRTKKLANCRLKVTS